MGLTEKLPEGPLTLGMGIDGFRRVLANLFAQARAEGREAEFTAAVDDVKSQLSGNFDGVTSFTALADAQQGGQGRKPRVRATTGSGSGSSSAAAA